MNNCLETTGGTSLLISIVTPVLNEETGIRGFLDHLAGLQGPFELIIVDGGSTDATVALVRDHAGTIPGTVNLLSAPRGRSIQMNAGAAAARGEILLFLHADCRIPADSLRVISEACSAPGVCGGAFTQECGDAGLFSTVCCTVANTLAAWSGLFFGDFGIFVRRDVFCAAGGFRGHPVLRGHRVLPVRPPVWQDGADRPVHPELPATVRTRGENETDRSVYSCNRVEPGRDTSPVPRALYR